MALSSKAAIINGIIQIVAGVIAMAFGIGLSVFHAEKWHNSALLAFCPGGWCGMLFVTGGIVMFIAGYKRNFCCTIGALVLAILNVTFGAAFFYFVIFEYAVKEHIYRCGYHVTPVCSDSDYRIAVFMLSASILAAFAELFAVVWAIVITSQALHREGCGDSVKATTPPKVHSNVKAHSNSLRFNWISQLASTIVSAVANCIILFIVAYGVQSDDDDHRSLPLQRMGMSLWCAPVYLLAAFCGFRAWRFGENSSLISFLVLNILQLALRSTELAISAAALVSVNARFDDEYDGSLFAFHFLVTTTAALHFCFSIWGIVAASIAIRQDDACSCCGGCCCAHDDDDRTDKIYFVTSSATPAFKNDQAGGCAIGGVPVVYEHGAMVGDVIDAGDVDLPPNYDEAVCGNHV